MTATVKVLRPSSAGTFNPATGKTTYPDPTEVWEGVALIQRALRMDFTRQIGDRQVAVRGTTVSIPADADEVLVGDQVKVLSYRDSDTGDPYLVGRPLWVHEVRAGSLLWQRDLVVLDAPPTRR